MTLPLRILMVEDDDADAELIFLRLAKEGFQVSWECVKTEAAYRAALGRPCDLILADWNLPQFSGLAALRIRRDCAISLPFIIISGSIGEEAAVEAMRAGAFDYISKDHLNRLGQSIHNALEQQRLVEEKRSAETFLRQSEEQYHILFETMPTGIVVLDGSGRMLSINPAALEMIGASLETLRNGVVFDLDYKMVDESGRELTIDEQPMLVALRTGRPVHRQMIGFFNEKEGRFRWVQTTAIPQLFDAQGKAGQLTVIFNDITELREAQENLRDTHQQLLALFQSSPLGISAVDREGRVQLWSAAAERLFGWSQQEVIGKELPIVPPHMVEEVRQQIREEIAGLPRIGMETIRQQKDGTTLEVSISTSPLRDPYGNISGSMAIYENITYRKQAEARLHLLSTALEAAANAIVITNQAGEIEWVNPAWSKLTGYSAQEVLKKTPRVLNSGRHERQFYQNLWQTILSGQVWRSEVTNQRKDGTLYTEDEMITPLVDEHGKITHFIGIKQDITARKQREHELKTMATMSAALRSAADRNEMLPIILDQLISLLHVDAATIEMLDPTSGELVIELGRGHWAPVTGARIARGQGLSAVVLATRQPYLNNAIQKDPRIFHPELFDKLSSAAGTLLMVQNKVLGLLWIGSHHPFTSQDVRLLTASADIAANAIHRATLHEQTEYRLRQLTALRTIDQAITSSFDLDKILKIFVEQVATHLGVDAAAVFLFQPKTFTLEFHSGYGFLHPDMPQPSIPLGEVHTKGALVGSLASHSAALSFADEDLRRKAMFEAENFAFHFAVPVVVKNELKGILEVFHRSRLNPTHEWLQFLEAFANQIAIGIDNTQMFKGLEQSNLDLTLAYDATIAGWSHAMDLRDQETEHHTRRVTELTLKIAKIMGISPEMIVHIQRGALLHDIGKLGVPDNILRKPGKFTDEEWAIMRQHPQYAYDMLVSIPYLHPALDIPYYHHEKWDGSGYPKGLKGEEIPFAARIFAIADVYDALTSDRPYRKAWSQERTLQYIRDEVGKQFDPQVAAVFFGLFESE